MLRHPPVMVRQVVQAALQGKLWRATQANAEHLAIAAVRNGDITVDRQTRALLLQDAVEETSTSLLQGTPSQMPPYRTDPAPSTRTASALSADALADLLGEEDVVESTPTTTSVSVSAGQADLQPPPPPQPPSPVPQAQTDTSQSLSAELVVTHDAPSLASSSSLIRKVEGKTTRPIPSFDVLDLTLGGGHHTAAILEAGAPYARVVALDCDHATRRTAAALREEFGTHRFQFFPHRMSEAETLFGNFAFDAVLLDPGPNVDQLEDVSRGFGVEDSMSGYVGADLVDLRYGPTTQTTASEWLALTPPDIIAEDLVYYTGLPARTVQRFVRALRKIRSSTTGGPPPQRNHTVHRGPAVGGPQMDRFAAPFASSHGGVRITADTLRTLLEEVAPEAPPLPPDVATTHGRNPAERHSDPGDLWHKGLGEGPTRRRPLASTLLYGIRCAVNNERPELVAGVRQALELVKPHGRVVALTRHHWETQLVEWTVANHPYAIQGGSDRVSPDTAFALQCPTETTVHSIIRTPEANYGLKNTVSPPTAEEMERSVMAFATGADIGPRMRGFPAENFGLGYKPARGDRETERYIREKAEAGVDNARDSGSARDDLKAGYRVARRLRYV